MCSRSQAVGLVYSDLPNAQWQCTHLTPTGQVTGVQHSGYLFVSVIFVLNLLTYLIFIRPFTRNP